ncbi:hypothetical protein HYC85_011254 [Camellia sinensis]|uniref:Uncharacterized protein n=1 Tax=Camellia sinensis TaxID=4442 RepID=A0A7J7HAJ6_CAMSI|nr:hypothetical protein HYC85_011254 [Camellia sinensis]
MNLSGIKRREKKINCMIYNTIARPIGTLYNTGKQVEDEVFETVVSSKNIPKLISLIQKQFLYFNITTKS